MNMKRRLTTSAVALVVALFFTCPKASATPSPTPSPVCVTPIVYVDDDWVGTTPGTDPDGGAGPATNFGCDSFDTIQGAVTAVPVGGTVIVYPGLYNEQVQIPKTLNLQGAKAGVDARTRSTAGESVINHACGAVQVMADNVVIDGFTIQGSTDSDPCFLSGIWTNPGFSGTQGGHRILNNIIQDNISGIELDSTCAANQTLVQFNLIQNNNNNEDAPGSGNGIQASFGLCNAIIDNNKFSGHANSSVLISSGGDDRFITVSNNELVGGAVERIMFGGVDDGAITGNFSDGSISTGPVRLFGGNNNISITGNVLLNGVRGIRVDNLIEPNTGVTAHGNCLAGNTTAGLEVESTGHTGTFDAEGNWWGSATGPTHAGNPGGTGDAVIDPDEVVDYTPFLTSNATTMCAPAASPTPTPPPAGGNGAFVIGDLDAVVGRKVYFWGSQWAKTNKLSGGAAPSAFKGFANSIGGTPPNCGGGWKSDPGNSSGPPNSVPTLITVIASSSVTKSGPVIMGNNRKIVVVRVDPGYGPNPGHEGRGTVVSVTCQ